MIDRILLFPYYLALKVRNNYYDKEGRKLFIADAPTISVGNVAAGGTGKTPHVEMILRMLQGDDRWNGRHLAVLSRGYMRESSGFQQVTVKGSATMFGDEPLQIKKKFPDVTVAVDRNRVEGCDLLCHPEKLAKNRHAKKCWDKDFPAADYIVLDDAFQYRKLKPTRSIVLMDYNHPAGKDMLLPLGRLRDLSERVDDADAIIVTKCPEELERSEKEAFVLNNLGIKDFDPFTHIGINRKGRSQLVLFTYIRYGQCEGLYDITDPRFSYAKKAIVVTGIAKDLPLRKYLSDFYKIIHRLSFPDHHKYTWADINKIQALVRDNPTATVITTEKDAQRILDFKGMPQELMERLLMVPITVDFNDNDEREALLDFISI